MARWTCHDQAPRWALRSSHTGFDAAAAAAERAREARDAALDDVGDADDALDARIDDLATELVGARLGSRQNPLEAFSRHTPSALVALPYATEAKEVASIVAKIAKKRPPAPVAKAAAASGKAAKAVDAALKALTKPQAAYTKALAARDALLPALNKAIRKLKKHAAAAWDEDEATYKAVFARPAAVQAPTKRSGPRSAPEAASTAGTD